VADAEEGFPLHGQVSVAESFSNYIQVVKAVVGSAKDRKTRKQLYPVVWDYEYLDMPVVKKSEQRRPVFTSETVTGIVAAAKPKYRMLYVLCASTGLRIGEALGIDIGKHISPDCSTITVREKVWKGQIQYFLKTDNGAREVDLPASVAAMLRTFIGDRTSGLLFCSRNGNPLSLSNILRRSLHPLLKKMGKSKAGSHAFRRFRITWLRKNGVPRDLENFWTGHAPETVGDMYSKLRDDGEFRKTVVEKVGLGFEIPASSCQIVPNVPKIAVGDFQEVAVSC
jgi:integrase